MQTFSEIVQSSVSLQTQHSVWKAIKTLQETLGVQKQALNNVPGKWRNCLPTRLSGWNDRAY